MFIGLLDPGLPAPQHTSAQRPVLGHQLFNRKAGIQPVNRVRLGRRFVIHLGCLSERFINAGLNALIGIKIDANLFQNVLGMIAQLYLGCRIERFQGAGEVFPCLQYLFDVRTYEFGKSHWVPAVVD